MTTKTEDLLHVLPGHATYFVLSRRLERYAFEAVSDALQARSGAQGDHAERARHWDALQVRMDGGARWDSVRQRYDGPLATVEDGARQRASLQTVTNVVEARGYQGHEVEGIRYTLDVFNPGGELGVQYAGAGDPILALLMEDAAPPSVRYPRVIRDQLSENAAFYEILKDLDGILQPEHVCGTYSMMSVLGAYLDGRVDSARRPWDFLFPLHVLKNPPIPLTPETRISGRPVGMLPGKEVALARVEDWGGGRVLIQVMAGLDAVIGWEYFAVAKALDMICVQQLVEGTAK